MLTVMPSVANDQSPSYGPQIIATTDGEAFALDPFIESISTEAEVNDVGPLLLIGAGALALIAVFGGTAAACRYMCKPKTVKTCNVDYFPTPKLVASCYN